MENRFPVYTLALLPISMLPFSFSGLTILGGSVRDYVLIVLKLPNNSQFVSYLQLGHLSPGCQGDKYYLLRICIHRNQMCLGFQ